MQRGMVQSEDWDAWSHSPLGIRAIIIIIIIIGSTVSFDAKHGLDRSSSQYFGICGANVLWPDALPDANPTYSWTNEHVI